MKYHKSPLLLKKASVMTLTDLPPPLYAAAERDTACLWCHQQSASGHACRKHMRGCARVNVDNWIYRVRFLQRDVPAPGYPCPPHCGNVFGLLKSHGRHTVTCQKRSGLCSTS